MSLFEQQSRQACRRSALRWYALVSLLVLCSGCEFPGQPNPADRPLPEDQVVEFEPLYRRNCAGCHGLDGQLGPAPPLNDPIFLAIVPHDELLAVIRSGRPRDTMPAFAHKHGGQLTNPQATRLAKVSKPA